MSDADGNPLLEPHRLPPFDRIRPEHGEAAVARILADNRAALNALLAADGPWDWSRLIGPIEAMDRRLERAFSPIRHLHAVQDGPAIRAVYERVLEAVTAYEAERAQDARLYRAYRALRERAAALDPAQRKLLDDAVRDFELAGVALPEPRRSRFREIQQQLAQAGAAFERNLQDATAAWEKPLDEDRLAPLPDSVRALLRAQARAAGRAGALLNLQPPVYQAVIAHHPDRALRRELYFAYQTRASDQGPNAGRWDNGPLIERILALRHEAARLLGFDNYAEYALATRMVRRPQAVLDFLTDLARRARPRAEAELAELREAAAPELAGEALAPWDVPYYAERLRRARYAIDEETLKAYFPAEHVLDGLFALAGKLFDVVVTPVPDAPRWHPDVRVWRVDRRDGAAGGYVYFDLYARPDKRGGAWMDECYGRARDADGVQPPVAFLTCNLNPPVDGRPALFTHDEVETLFHEFGHALHHLLTTVDHWHLAGLHGVEWDAVELPSQLLENWVWEPAVLRELSAHYRSGEPLPEALIEALQRSRRFNAALRLVKQIEYALFDMRLHLEYDPARGARAQQILDAVRAEVAVLPVPAEVRFQNGFSHIFVGGYAAGYYSYLWAEALAVDAFAEFQRGSARQAGERFWREVLAVGATRSAAENVRAFLGREPDPGALLRRYGLSET